MDKKQNFYFTFGVNYHRETHPRYEKCDPNGWVRIIADSYETARLFAIDKLFGVHFAFMYTEKEFKPIYFPHGEIEVFEV